MFNHAGVLTHRFAPHSLKSSLFSAVVSSNQGKSFQDPATVMEMNRHYQKTSQTAVDQALQRFSLDSNVIRCIALVVASSLFVGV